MIRLISFCAAVLVSTAVATAEDFPRIGYAGAVNGQPGPFAGAWSMGFPEPEGTIVAETLVGCEDPVRIEAVSDIGITVKSPAMAEAVAFELSEFEGRTTWFPADNSPTVIAVWLTPDSFHYYVTDMGRANWDDPRLFKRCAAE